VAPEYCEGIDDPLLAETLPTDADIVRVAAWDESLCRKLGFGILEYRALWPLYRAGGRLLRARKYDVVFFSTTAFLTLVLGPIWRRRFGCRIVYDIQDPWYQGKELPYDRHNAPGGWNKYRLAQAIARYAEAFAMRGADRVISVSDGYVESLTQRYGFLDRDIFSVVPFGAAHRDHEVARGLLPKPAGKRDAMRWVSVGRPGTGADGILATFFGELAKLRQRNPDAVSRLRVDFIGTNYAPADRSEKLVAPIAAKFGLDDIVTEKSERIPYFEALASYADSDAILLFGSTSPDYVASKLFNCVLAGKPILVMFQAQSFVARIAPTFPNIHLATFSASPDETDFAREIAEGFTWLRSAQFDEGDIDRALQAWSAEALSAAQCKVFDSACMASR
jgi:hypothetical protein